MDNVFKMTINELVPAVAHKQIGVEELVHIYLNRIQKYDGEDGLNAVCEINENAIEQAKHMDSVGNHDDLPMFGMPVLVKDNIDVEGLRTTAGSLALSDNIALRDADVIGKLRRNGAIVLGKTNLTEFANYTGQNMPNGFSSSGGQVKSAYNRESDPGGSSSGSAVAVSAGLCAAAVGTDTSFSIVACANINGVTGFKPSAGTLSSNGIIPLSKTLDSAGPITRSLDDAITMYNCMRATPLTPLIATDPDKLHIAVNIHNRDMVSEAQLSKYSTVISDLRKNGGCVTEVKQEHTPYQKVVMRCEFRQGLEDYLAGSKAKRKSLREIIDFYEANPACMIYGISCLLDAVNASPNDDDYIAAIIERKRIKEAIFNELHKYDACLMTGPTNIMHFTGLPSVAIRLGMGDDYTPRGMILYGVDERRLLSAALTLEKYCPPTELPLLA